MADTFPPSAPDAGGRGQHGGERVNIGRAVVLLVVAVVAGVLLLGVASRPTVVASTTTTTTTVPTHTSSTTTTTTSVVKSGVTVQVANGSSVSGVAGDLTDDLKSLGWNTLAAENTTNGQTLPTTTVYYAAGMEAAAAEIASALQLKPSAVQPLTTSAPVASTAGTDVLVVVGSDIAARVAGHG